MLNTIAVGTDGSDTASGAVAAAIDLAAQSSARLVVITSYQRPGETVVQEDPETPQELRWAATAGGDADTIVTQAADRASSRGVKVTKVARAGNPAEVLCTVAAEQHADVLIVGNKGMHRRVLGSVPNSVAHKAPCSVLIVKTTSRERFDPGDEHRPFSMLLSGRPRAGAGHLLRAARSA